MNHDLWFVVTTITMICYSWETI